MWRNHLPGWLPEKVQHANAICRRICLHSKCFVSFVSGQIVDDEMNALLVQRLPPGVRLTAIFDSCHSATALDLPYIYDCDGNIKKQKASRKKAGEYFLSDVGGPLKWYFQLTILLLTAMSALEAAMDLRSGNVLGLLSSGKDAINALTAISKDIQGQSQGSASIFNPIVLS